MLRRRSILAGLLAVAFPALGEAPSRSRHPVPRPSRDAAAIAHNTAESLVAEANLGGTVSYAVATLGVSDQIFERLADSPMPPASVAKAVTALYALDRLGPDYRFETRVMRVGPMSGGTLNGDLFLVGGGDPNLDSDQLGDLVAALAATGLRRVTGRFIFVDGALPFRERLVADQPDHVGYNPALSGLNLNYNRVHFEWARAPDGWTTTLDARGERFSPAVDIAEVRIVSRDLPIFTYERATQRDRWSVASTALDKPGSRWLPVRDPGAYAAAAFVTLAASHGIALPKPTRLRQTPTSAELITAHRGPPLTEVLRSMLKYSTNITAEVVGLTASGAGEIKASAQAMNDWARGSTAASPDLRDHSGLNAASQITTRDMLALLQSAKQQRHGALLEGLLREVELEQEGVGPAAGNSIRVLAKSGTMNFVSGLAGYIRGPDQKAMVFAIFSADFPRREAVPVEDREAPPGATGWAKRARRLQTSLIAAWTSALS